MCSMHIHNHARTHTHTHTHTFTHSLSHTLTQGGFVAMASFPHALPPDIDDFNTLSLRVKADGCVVCARATHAYLHTRIFGYLFARTYTHTYLSALNLA